MTTDRAERIWREYERGVRYNSAIGLYETVRRNEEFYIGDQWNGLQAPDLDKPVLNFLKRVCSYLVAMLVSDDIGVKLTPFDAAQQNSAVCAALEREVLRVIERTKMRARGREILRNCVVDGDGCFFWYFDPDAIGSRAAQGEIGLDVVENTRILFGDPYEAEVQRQPYLLIVKRESVASLRRRAALYGVPPALFCPDSGEAGAPDGGEEGGSATVLLRMYKRDGRVFFSESTRTAMLREEIDSRCTLYPVAYMSYERVRSSYHGRAAVTGLIPNQIAVNKLWAMAIRHQHMMAFPKVFYDRQKIGEWSNRVGEAIGVVGNPSEAVATSFRAGDMSGQLLTLVDRTIQYTKEFMGASDAALGNIRPDNASAIIAVQQAAAAPLELQKLAYFQFVEDSVRVIIDLIRASYGRREVVLDGRRQTVDFSSLGIDAMSVQVDVGVSPYWSELMQVQTLDNMFAKGIVTDAIAYLESVPDHLIPGKSRLLESLRRRKEEQDEMQHMPAGDADTGRDPA